MPVLSAKHKVLFLLAPGTGSSAVSKGVLLPSLDGTYVPAESIRDEAGNVVVSHWHATVSDLRRFGLLSDEELKDLLKFTSVRNPFDVLVTEYIRLRAQGTNGFSDHDARHVSPSGA